MPAGWLYLPLWPYHENVTRTTLCTIYLVNLLGNFFAYLILYIAKLLARPDHQIW